jgi:glycerol kinase
MRQYVLAIDQGTTGTTALLFDQDLNIHGKVNIEFPQYFPEPSWVEHDLEEIWGTVVSAVKGALSQAKVSGNQIAAIGITNQRETTCLWERGRDAKPVCRAIVWQDRRTAAECEKLKKRGLEKTIHKKTGLVLDPYFSATKLQWMLKNVPNALARAKHGEIIFGNIESYLLYRMSGEHKTEASNASRTLLMDIKKCEWDDSLLKLFGIPRNMLPAIHPSAVEYGKTRGFPGLPDGIPITGLVGDQQAALFGQACFRKGMAKCTYGTGAFILVNTGEEPIFSKHRLLTTVGWQLGGKTTYALEGSAFIAGAAVQWVRDGLGTIQKSADVESLATTVSDSDGVTFVPALSGMGAPHWLSQATGLITGITRRTTKAHIARATLDGVAFQVRELLEAMTKDYKKKVAPVKADGGAAANNLLMQFQADLLNVDVVRSEILETTALGSGLMAGLAVGYWNGLDEIEKRWKANRVFKAEMSATKRKTEIARWDLAMKAVSLLAKS